MGTYFNRLPGLFIRLNDAEFGLTIWGIVLLVVVIALYIILHYDGYFDE